MEFNPAERARERAELRQETKSIRASQLGIRLPKKKKKGWEGLRARLHEGTLLHQLRKIDAMHMHDGDLQRKSKVGDSISHVASKIRASMGLGGFSAGGLMEEKMNKEAKLDKQEKDKRQRIERQQRRKLIKKQRKLERELEYLNFPTIMGWYFDGFFTPYFQLNQEYATIFNAMELEISKNKEKSIKETFAEKAKRYFWPPDLLAGLCFRTRGIYLDFEDIMKDPPHTPPDIVLDQRVEAVTLFTQTEVTDVSEVASEEDVTFTSTTIQTEEELLQRMLHEVDNDQNLSPEQRAQKKRMILIQYKKKKEKLTLQQQIAEEMHLKATGKNDFYFDDQIPGFFRKRAKDRDKYYFDTQWGVWRKKRNIIHFPNDYYWDEQLALFFPKDRTRRPEYYAYDPELAVYKVAGENAPLNWRGITPSHFYFDHKVGKWVKKSRAPANQVPYFDQYGQRNVANKKHDTPDDYFYNNKTQDMEKKTGDGKQYYFDPVLGAWRLKDSGPPTKGSQKPFHFYWNETEHVYKKKDAPSSFFVYDFNNSFFRKKKSLHGKYHPKNWSWNEKKKEWEIRKSMSRHIFMSDSLYWRADRDYDKPWLEYIGGYKDYYIEYEYDMWGDEEFQVGGGKEGDKTRTATSAPALTSKGGKVQVTSSGGKGLGGTTSSSRTITTTTTKTTSSGRVVPGSSKDGAGATSKRASAAGLGRKSSVEPSKGVLKDTSSKPPPALESDQDALLFVDKLDRKVLKITGVKNIDDLDLRKYFASVKKVVRPKVPGTELEEDYAYLKFKTDEGAAAALKTMHEQLIKGHQVYLQYKLKAEDETVGGQRDVGNEMRNQN